MKNFTVRPIGKISVNDEGMPIQLDRPYLPAKKTGRPHRWPPGLPPGPRHSDYPQSIRPI